MIAGSPVPAKVSVASPHDLKVEKGLLDHLGRISHLVIRCLPIGVTSLHEQTDQLGTSASGTKAGIEMCLRMGNLAVAELRQEHSLEL